MIEYLVWAFIVYALIKLGAFLQRMQYEMELDELEDEENENPQDVIAMIELHNGVMYAYDNSMFLGQGATMEELEEHMRSRIKELYTTSVRVQLMTEDKELIAKYKLTPI